MAQQYTCAECAFRVRSEDENELIDLVRTHADDKHDMSMSRQDVRSGMESA